MNMDDTHETCAVAGLIESLLKEVRFTRGRATISTGRNGKMALNPPWILGKSSKLKTRSKSTKY
jgi:hypothetical protein